MFQINTVLSNGGLYKINLRYRWPKALGNTKKLPVMSVHSRVWTNCFVPRYTI